MPGEKLLVVDDSLAVQEIAKNLLEENGYKVITASNGFAALTFPELNDIDMVVIDADMAILNGYDVTKLLRQDEATFDKPVLILVSEEETAERYNVSLKGANGYLLKPFTSQQIINKIQDLLEEQRIRIQSRKYLQEAADKYMQQIAEVNIQNAVEKKTQIIVERTIQNVISLIDQKARKEVDAKITSLTAEKEQELVKMTVHEVARSMVEKLAERKVTEAMDAILNEQTEKTVKRCADGILPSLIRERLKETIDNTLPREIQNRVEKAAAQLVPEVSNKIVIIVEDVAKKTIPKVAREGLPELIDKQVSKSAAERVPSIIQNVALKQVQEALNSLINPRIEDAIRIIKTRVSYINLAILALVLISIIINAKPFLDWIKSLATS